MTHELKILPEFYEEIIWKRKRFELRKDDRGYQEDHYLFLRECTANGKYTGRAAFVKIDYVLRSCPEYGLMDGYCILSLSDKITIFEELG